MTWGNSSGRRRRPLRRPSCVVSRKRLPYPAPPLSPQHPHVVPRRRLQRRRPVPLPYRQLRSRPRHPRPFLPRLLLRWQRQLLLPALRLRLRPPRSSHPPPPLRLRLRPRQVRVPARPHPVPPPPPQLRLRRLRHRQLLLPPYSRRLSTPVMPPGLVRFPVRVAPVDCPVASASPAPRARATTRSLPVRAWACSVPAPKAQHRRQSPPAVPASVPTALTVPAVRVRPGTACRGPVAAWQACLARTRR